MGAQAFGELLKRNTTIQWIHLNSENDLLLGEVVHKFKRWHFTDNGFGERGAKAFCELMTRNPTIQRIDIVSEDEVLNGLNRGQENNTDMTETSQATQSGTGELKRLVNSWKGTPQSSTLA